MSIVTVDGEVAVQILNVGVQGPPGAAGVQADDTATLTNKTIASFTNTVQADEVHFEVANDTGSTIAKGAPVCVTGYSVGQDRVSVGLADAGDPLAMPAIGLAEEDIAAGATGGVVVVGRVEGVDTSAWDVGDLLYVNGAGLLTSTPPTGADVVQPVAVVLRSNPSTGILEARAVGAIPRASETDVGVLRLATEAAVAAGVEADTAVTPATLAPVVSTLEGATTAAQEDATQALADAAAAQGTADAAIPATEKGAAGGVATLDADGLVAQAPAFTYLPATGKRNAQWYGVGDNFLSTGVLGDWFHFIPFAVAQECRISAVAVEVTVASTAASPVGRVGIYADNGLGAPGALLVDAGAYDPATVGVQEVALGAAVSVPPGVYWTCVAYAGGAGRPSMRCAKVPFLLANDASVPVSVLAGSSGVIQTGYAGGGLPSVAATTSGSRTNVPTLAYKVLVP